MNHILDNKYLIDTKGSSLVIVVIIIHMNIKYMTIDIGWYAILLSNFLKYNNLAIKKNKTPNNNGSTGTDSDRPTPFKLMDRGVKKAIRKRTLS